MTVTDGGRGIGVEAVGTRYPLVNPSEDVRGLFADFYLFHRVEAVTLPLRISWIRDIGQPIGATPDLIVKDASGATVFDSTTATTRDTRAWGSRFVILEWRKADAYCRALVHTGAEEVADERIYAAEFEPDDAELDERTHEASVPQLRSVTVNGTTITGDVVLVSGYNQNAATATPLGRSRRSRSKVVFNAAPGDGVGRYPACSEVEPVIRRVNGVAPDANGNLVISATQCYWVERPISYGDGAVPALATLKLHNDCGPCCACEDYENTYRGVRRLYARYREIGQRAEIVRDGFQSNIDRWMLARQCRIEHPTRVNALATYGQYIDVAASFCNVTPDTKYNVTMRLNYTHSRNLTGTIVSCASLINASTTRQLKRSYLGGSWPEWTNTWDCLEPGRAIIVRMRLYFESVIDDDVVTVTVLPEISGVYQPQKVLAVPMSPCGG